MKRINPKVAISIVASIAVAAAFVWLVVRVFSSGYSPSMPTYFVARDSTWYPVDLRGKEKNMVGFANDLMQKIADLKGFRVQVFEVGHNALFDGLDTERYEGVLSSLEPNPVTRRRYFFSEPFYRLGPVIVVPVSSNIRTNEDLRGKIIGMEDGTLQLYDLSEPPDVMMIPYSTASTALEKLDANVVDAVIMDVLRAYVFTEGFYAGRLKVVSSPLTDRGFRLVSRNHAQFQPFIDQFNQGLQHLKENGEYTKLLDKWGLTHTEIAPESEEEQ